jgi:hypothetical protein
MPILFLCSLNFFVVFARPDDTSRTGEKLCISFAVIFTAKHAKYYARLNESFGQAKGAKPC